MTSNPESFLHIITIDTGKMNYFYFVQIKDYYYGVPRDAVHRFCQSCQICTEQRSQQSRPATQAIKTRGVHKRGLVSYSVDLIQLFHMLCAYAIPMV